MTAECSVCAVAWDVDGTLVDSEPLHLRALQAVCQAHGVDIRDHGPTPFIGVAIADVWQQLAPRFARALGHHPDGGEREFRAGVTAHYLAHAHEVRVLPGARAALEYLARTGVVQAAVSNSERAIVVANLRTVGAHAAFSAIVSLDDVQQPKPAPEPYTRALSMLGVPAESAWAVEDSPSGARSARAAGLQVLVVGDDPQARGEYRLPGLTQFVPWWQSIASRGLAAPHDITRQAVRRANA